MTPFQMTKLGPKGLATELEKRTARMDVASDAVRALAANGLERWNDTIARLGDVHAAVVKYTAARAVYDDAIGECHRRYGAAVTYSSMWITFLRVRAVR